jgi:arabinogalactan endo-1,4-beta-galactosidase
MKGEEMKGEKSALLSCWSTSSASHLKRGRLRDAEAWKNPPLFNHTGKTVVGLKALEKAKTAELARVKALAGVWGDPGAGY